LSAKIDPSRVSGNLFGFIATLFFVLFVVRWLFVGCLLVERLKGSHPIIQTYWMMIDNLPPVVILTLQFRPFYS
jgi:hypothetical protein